MNLILFSSNSTRVILPSAAGAERHLLNYVAVTELIFNPGTITVNMLKINPLKSMKNLFDTSIDHITNFKCIYINYRTNRICCHSTELFLHINEFALKIHQSLQINIWIIIKWNRTQDKNSSWFPISRLAPSYPLVPRVLEPIRHAQNQWGSVLGSTGIRDYHPLASPD